MDTNRKKIVRVKMSSKLEMYRAAMRISARAAAVPEPAAAGASDPNTIYSIAFLAAWCGCIAVAVIF